MIVAIAPSTISGTVSANPSKSHAQRAIALAGLARGTSVLREMSQSEDAQAAIDVVRTFARVVQRDEKTLEITGSRDLESNLWNCRESGFSLRMFTAIAGIFKEQITIDGTGSLRKRPVEFMVDAMQHMGAACTATQGRLPLLVKGPVSAGQYSLDGSISSQLVSGALIALPLASGDSLLQVQNLKSRPYVDLTISSIKQFGITIHEEENDQFRIVGGQSYSACDIAIEGDWSGAAFLLAGAALSGGTVSVRNLDTSSLQSDSDIIAVLSSSGSMIQSNDRQVTCSGTAQQAFAYDATNAPDLFPPLVSLAAGIQGTSVIRGVKRLYHKESNRLETLQSEFGKLGVHIEQNDQEMLVHGGRISGGTVTSHNDHRIAMALAIAGLVAEEPVIIEDAECVDKSYPRFFEDLKQLGTHVAVH